MEASAGFLARDADRDRVARAKAAEAEAAALVAEAARLQRELAAVEEAVERAPQDGGAWQRRAEVYLARGRTADAIADYKQAVSLAPEQEDWMVKMWDLEKQLADERAEAARKRAAEEADRAARAAQEAERTRAKEAERSRQQQWREDNADKHAESQKQAKILQAEILKDRGNEQFKEGQYEEASKLYSRALAKLGDGPHPTETAAAAHAACLLNRAACALKLGLHEASAEDCSVVLGLEPTNAKALYRRGLAFAAMEMRDAAIADLRVAATLKPEDASIKKQLAKLAKAAEQ